jgi:hypothetical protein
MTVDFAILKHCTQSTRLFQQPFKNHRLFTEIVDGIQSLVSASRGQSFAFSPGHLGQGSGPRGMSFDGSLNPWERASRRGER